MAFFNSADKADMAFHSRLCSYAQDAVMNVPACAGARIQWITSTYLDMRPLCESPIEKLLLAHLVFCDDGMNLFGPSPASRPEDIPGSELTPQGRVGRFRADFLITLKGIGAEGAVAVECDGHEFHERTKFQAARDRARDRYFAAHGVTVLRFTGSEIYHDGQACAKEVESIVAARVGKAFSVWPAAA